MIGLPQYKSEERTGKIFSVFAIISIIIASLGLFGLSAFSIAQRTKEIGVRKVLGANVSQVVIAVIKRFFIHGADSICSCSAAYLVCHV
jgi:putative ABC transport system permease protein